MSDTSNLVAASRAIQEADACLLSGNGITTRDQIYQARQELRKAVIAIQVELDSHGLKFKGVHHV